MKLLCCTAYIHRRGDSSIDKFWISIGRLQKVCRKQVRTREAGLSRVMKRSRTISRTYRSRLDSAIRTLRPRLEDFPTRCRNSRMRGGDMCLGLCYMPPWETFRSFEGAIHA